MYVFFIKMYVFLSKSAVFVKMGIFVKTYVFRWVFCRNMYFCHYVRFCQNVFVSSEWAILVKMYGFGQIYICWAKSFFVVKMLFCTNVRFCQMTTLCYFLRYCAILCGSVRFWQKVHFSSYCSKMWSFLFLFFLNFGPFYICSSYICAYYFCSSYFCRFLHLVFLFLRILYLSLPILGLPIFGLPMFALPIFVTSYIWSSYFWSSYFRSFLYLSLPIFGLPIFGFPIFALPIFVTSYIWSSYFWSSYVCVPINASSYNCSFLGPVLPVKWGGTVHMKQNIVITCWFSSLNRFRGKMLLSGAVWHSIGNYVVCWLDFTWWCPVMKCTSMFPYSIYPDIDFQYWWMTYQCDNCSAECRNLNFDQTKWFFMSLWLGATTSLWWGQV